MVDQDVKEPVSTRGFQVVHWSNVKFVCGVIILLLLLLLLFAGNLLNYLNYFGLRLLVLRRRELSILDCT